MKLARKEQRPGAWDGGLRFQAWQNWRVIGLGSFANRLAGGKCTFFHRFVLYKCIQFQYLLAPIVCVCQTLETLVALDRCWTAGGFP